MTLQLDDIIDDFSYLTDWEDRYKYIIELGKTLEPLCEDQKIDANKVRGCASQVWLLCTAITDDDNRTILHFSGDSDALIVRGLVAIALVIFNNKAPHDILTTDAGAVFEKINLREHLSAQRANGLSALIQKIKAYAAAHSAPQA